MKTTHSRVLQLILLFSLRRGQVKPVLGRFSELKDLFIELGLGNRSVDAALLDAGCSSMQMDMAERGFSLSKDGPLDMRMDGDRCLIQLFSCFYIDQL